jgi:pantoate--beta-alanine ligase
MKRVTSIAEARAAVAQSRADGRLVGLVPTMGAFHEGHLSLMRRARADCGHVAVSLFVNPIQFGPQEDLTRYPRDPDRDAMLAHEVGVDLLFEPGVDEMYPTGFATFVEVERLSGHLCGRSRPGHFRGVATVVTKLFSIIAPDRAYFGRKDYQQLRIIERLTSDLSLPVVVVSMPIVREADGVAMSSRNRYLSPEERVAARVLHESLSAANAEFARGERDGRAIAGRTEARIRAEPRARLEYAEVVDAGTLEPIAEIRQAALLAVAAHFGTTRLIDSTLLGVGEPP